MRAPWPTARTGRPAVRHVPERRFPAGRFWKRQFLKCPVPWQVTDRARVLIRGRSRASSHLPHEHRTCAREDKATATSSVRADPHTRGQGHCLARTLCLLLRLCPAGLYCRGPEDPYLRRQTDPAGAPGRGVFLQFPALLVSEELPVSPVPVLPGPGQACVQTPGVAGGVLPGP